VHLQQLKLTHFKNYERAELRFSPHLNCFVGLNGMGKTNLLDAVYYLCMTKSYFATTERNVMQHEANFFRLEGVFERLDKQEKIVAKVIPGKRKEVERNGVAYNKLSEHIGLLPVVIIAPHDTHIVLEGSEARRNFVDNTLSQLDEAYLQQLIVYNKVLNLRNATLKQFAENHTFNAELLQAYDQQLIPPGEVIHAKRAEFLLEFKPLFLNYYALLSGSQEEVDYDYVSKLNDADFSDLLAEAREKDRILQRSTVGIHKDEVQFLIDEQQVKRFASQGQLKSFVLALKLAQYDILKAHKQVHPILLLDDIFDKLDNRRVKHLLKLLIEHDFGQVFITDTDTFRVENIIKNFGADFAKFTIEKGRARQDESV